MFKQVKSLVFWTLLYKFRRKVIIIAILLAMIFFAQWIYSDVVEYLKLTQQLNYLNYILPAKWIMIFSNIGISIYLILSIFKPQKEERKQTKKNISVKEENKESKEKFTQREQELINKKLRSKADILLDK